MKVCEMCGAQNDDVFTKCAVCGADLPSPNGEVGDDEKTVLIDSDQDMASKSGLSLKTDTASYGQQDAQPGFGTQPQMGQPGFGAQPQMGQPGFGAQPQMGQPGFGAQPQMGQPGFGAQPQMGQPGFGGPAASQQPKAKKGLIIGILAGAAVVLAVALFLIFGGIGGKGGVDSPEAVAKTFIEAMDEQDADKLAELCPPFLDAEKEDLEDMMDMYSGFDISFKYEGVESKEAYEGDDLKDLEEEVSDYSDRNVKLQAAYDVEFKYTMEMTYLGETQNESSTETFTCIKYKGKWYLYDF